MAHHEAYPGTFWAAAAGVPFLAPLGGDDRAVLEQAATRRDVREDEVLLGGDTPSDSLYIVASGALTVAIASADGGTIELNRLYPGDYCGELSLVRHEHSGAVVRALRDSVVWALPHAVLGEIAERSPALNQALLQILAARLGETNRRLRELRSDAPVVLWSTSAPPAWSALLAARVSERAAALLDGPVALVDISGSAAALPGVHLAAESVDAFSRLGGARLAVRAVPAEAVVDEVRRLRSRFHLVVVHATHGHPGAPLVEPLARSTVWCAMESDAQAPGGVREAVILRPAPVAPTEGERHALSRRLGVEVVRIVPGGLGDLARETRDEPSASVSWLARHLLRRKVGLALGAGGVKGYAHLGVLEELAAAGVEVDYVAGTSIGAPLATATVLNMAPSEIRRHMDDLFAGLGQFRLPWRAIWTSDRLRVAFERLCAGRAFEDLDRPLAIVAADLNRREEYVFRRGRIAEAILASLSIPAVFPPVVHEGRLLVDGAVLNPVPVSTLRAAGADIVIGVTLTPPASDTPPRRGLSLLRPPVVDTVMRAFDLMQWKITSEGAARADISIEPAFSGPTGLRDYRRGDEYAEAGRAAASTVAARLRALGGERGAEAVAA